MTPAKFGFGAPARRKEDDALVRGAGRYVADCAPAGALHAVVLRSPHAHARYRITDVAKAKGMPGVALVLTAADLASFGDLPCQGLIPDTKVAVPPYPLLARDEVRHVGDAVAFVVAHTLDAARDAAEAIAIEWTALPHVIGAADALAPDAPPVWPKALAPDGNLAFKTELGDAKATARAFAAAAHTVSLTLRNQRLVTNYLDTRGVVAEYDGDRITLTLSSQGSHSVRDVLCAEVFKIEPEKMRVVTPDVGGGFGTKLFVYREYALAGIAAQRLKRPVKWVAERSEHFLGDAQGRDNITTAKLALDGDGRFVALDIDLLADMGAYLSLYAPFIPFIGAGMSPGVYDLPACHVRVRGAFTNTVPVDAYRGAGRPEAAYVIERLVDVAARELGVAPDALRRKNFIKGTPYTTATGKTYDSGDFAHHLGRAQDSADWSSFERRLAKSREAGRLRGIGIATYVEACGNNGPDTARVRLDDDGAVTVLAGTQSTGQGHATAYAQIVADYLHLPPDMCAWFKATPTRSRPEWGQAGRARSRAAARRWRVQARSWPAGSRTLPPMRSRRLPPISNSMTARCASSARTGRSPSPSSRAGPRRGGGRFRPKTLSRRRRQPIPTAPIWPRSRSIRRLALRASSATGWSTISG
jgi:aerobic carbon-monoxide dehydrogenase large subunit